jgi:hypothetical protein
MGAERRRRRRRRRMLKKAQMGKGARKRIKTQKKDILCVCLR